MAFVNLSLCLCLSFSLLNIGCQTNPYRQGHQLYKFHCESCHMEDGSGLKRLIPSLEASDMFTSTPDRLICLIRHGRAKNEGTGQQMPPNTLLNEVEIANLVNYMIQLYSSPSDAVTTEDVKTYLSHCVPE